MSKMHQFAGVELPTEVEILKPFAKETRADASTPHSEAKSDWKRLFWSWPTTAV